MKKNRMNLAIWQGKVPQNLFRKMRLTLFFSFIMLLQVGAMNVSIAQKRVTLSLKDVMLKDFFAELRQQTGDIIVFSNTEINTTQRVSVDTKNELITDILDRVLKNLDLGYKVVEGYIVVFKHVPQKQAKSVSGLVTDKNKESLPGVTVLVKGSSIGVVTDIDGRYRLVLPEQKDIFLVFSFVGMKTQEVKYTGQDSINVVLEEDVEALNEVVVTGIFRRNKELATGASTTITSKELKQIGNQNILQSLRTLDPSFKIVESKLNGSNPNVLPEVELRGANGITDLDANYKGNPNQPLFILDGFETTLQTVVDLNMDRVASVTRIE